MNSKQFFWLYVIALSLIGAGFADYSLIAFHFDKSGQIAVQWIPVMYAIAMGSDAISALVLGHLFDKFGIKTLIGSTVIAAFFAPLVFWGNNTTALIGMILWGIGMGAMESIVNAVLASIFPAGKRATGFGLFNAIFGMTWFAGSALMGWLYDHSITSVVLFSLIIQLLSLPFFIKLSKMKLAR
nr:MFS transporter [Microbacter margulisiae]